VTGPIRVTHPFHPLFGQELDFFVHRHHYGESRVYYRDRQGFLASLPISWTSAAPEDPLVVVSDGRSRLRVDDLIELVALVNRLRR